MANTGDFKDEYKDVSDNMRFYANMRFAQLTILVAVTSALIIAIFSQGSVSAPAAKVVIKLSGMTMAVLLLIMEERAVQYWDSFRKRAIELENLLDYCQYTNLPKRGLLTATRASALIHAAVIVFWIVTLVRSDVF